MDAARQRPEEDLLESGDLARTIVDLLSDRQAEDIVLLDISKVSSITDYFVIATATSTRQMDAIADSLSETLRQDGVRPRIREGTADSRWLLVDYGDVIIHLFSPETRTFYNLESLWNTGVQLVRIQ